MFGKRTEMNDKERLLLAEAVGDMKPELCLKARVGLDAGRWWRLTPVWLCVVADQLVMLAVSRRRYIAQRDLSECRESYYYPATGELKIEPGEDLEFSSFAMSTRDALTVLKYLKAV